MFVALMHRVQRFFMQENTLVFFFCMAVISGPAIATLFAYDLTNLTDANTYLGLAHFDFDQSPVRRFRVIVPFLAAGLNYLLGGAFGKLAPAYFTGDFGLPFSFFVVNSLLISYFGLLIYRYCKAYGAGVYMALLGTLVMLTCRHTATLAGMPMVDSLFCVVVAMSLLGIKERNTGMLVCAIFLGPFAKEAFIFIAPIIFFYSHIHKGKQVLLFAASGVLVFTYRYIYELYAPVREVSGLMADVYHLYWIKQWIPQLLSFKGIYKMLSIPWLWLGIPVLAAWVCKGYTRSMKGQLDGYMVWLMVSVVLQMLMSGTFERMFYVSMPVWCVIVALSANELKKLYMSVEK